MQSNENQSKNSGFVGEYIDRLLKLPPGHIVMIPRGNGRFLALQYYPPYRLEDCRDSKNGIIDTLIEEAEIDRIVDFIVFGKGRIEKNPQGIFVSRLL